MSFARILALALVVACSLASPLVGARVLCIEPDGEVKLEEPAALCCDVPASDPCRDEGGSEHTAEAALHGSEDCCRCIDIPIASARSLVNGKRADPTLGLRVDLATAPRVHGLELARAPGLALRLVDSITRRAPTAPAVLRC